MSLYFVRHQHNAETCPAKNPEMGQMLIQHVSKRNARRFGVDLLADAVLLLARQSRAVRVAHHVHDDRLLRFRPQVDRNVVVPVAENARLDGQVAHALAQPLFPADRAALDHHAGRFADSLKDADLGAK